VLRTAVSSLAPRSLSRTRTGAEPSLARSYLCGYGGEVIAAKLAGSNDRPGLASTDIHDGFVFLNDSSTAVGGAVCVAFVTGGNEVLDRVIGRVEVDVVCDECSFDESCSGHPVHGRVAPMAGVWAEADLVVKDDAAERDDSRWRRDWMSWCSGLSVLYPRFLGSWCGCIARHRAEAVSIGAGIAVGKFATAVLAYVSPSGFSCHRTIIQKEGNLCYG